MPLAGCLPENTGRKINLIETMNTFIGKIAIPAIALFAAIHAGYSQPAHAQLDAEREARDLRVEVIRAKMDSIRRVRKRPTVALVLSGGGAKGSAHVGVIRYLESIGMPVDMVMGTSMGGLVGGIYALGYNAGQLDSLNASAREDSLEVIRNLNEINSRFTRLTDLMKNERDRLNDIADNGGIFVDTSTDVNSASRIVSCRNMADISGDSLTGGIAGTIGVEYDLDPDEDILRTNSRSLDYSFGVSAAIFDSVNAGGVSARANHAGGITGKADLGYLKMNTNEGDVTSEDGYFIGGIAGYSEASLEGNTARCRVTGKKNTGGICGYGKELWDNRAVVTVLGTEEYAGTIAGNVDSLDPENLRNNLYYSGNYGAVDDIDLIIWTDAVF